MRRPADAGRRSPTFDVLIGAVRPAILVVDKAQYRAGKGEGAMTEERIRELTKSMLRKKLYVVLSKGGAAPEKIAEHLSRHLEYMIGLEKKGVLFASGPLAEADGKTRGDGLTILRAASAQAAREIAEADPFVVNGLRSFELREWTVMEGSLGIKVNFSDQSLELA
jgi:uncharacterized protein